MTEPRTGPAQPADRLHLLPRHREKLAALLRQHLPGVEVWAYGSRVNGQSHDSSDLDLVLRGPDLQEIPTGRLADFREALRESTIPFLVEARDWAHLPERFQREIEREYVVVAEREERKRVGWHETSVEEIAEKVAMGPFGSDIKSDNFVPSGVPVIRGGNLTAGRFRAESFVFLTDEKADQLASANAYPGELVFTHRGTLGQVGLIPDTPFQRYVISQSQMKLTCRASEVVPAFLYYFFKSPLGQHALLMNTSQTGVPAISRPVTSLKSIRLALPPLPEQRAIAHILGTLDDKIELNRRMNVTLDDMARTLFTSWFVHFDPVHAKAALTQRASPGGSVWPVARAYLDRLEPALAALFPDRFVDSALGPIPAKWELSTIGQETQAVGGGTPSTKEPAYWHDARHYWATPKDLAKLTSPVLLNTARKISDAGLEKISSGLLPVGTVLLSSRAPIGYLAMTEVPTAINQGFIALICPGRLSHWYVLHWCAEHLEAIKAIAGGSTFAEISKQTFRPLPVPIPPRPLLLAFATAVRPLYRRTVVNMRESAVLATLRDTLLPKLLSGDIRVRDAAEQVERLA